MVFIRLPSAASRKTLTEAPSSDQSTPSHTVALVPAGASFLRWVAPPSDAERKQAAAATSLLDGEDYSDYGPIGTTGKTGRTFTRNVTVKKDGTKAKKAKVEDEAAPSPVVSEKSVNTEVGKTLKKMKKPTK